MQVINELDNCHPAFLTTSSAKGSVKARTLANLIGEVEIAIYPNKAINIDSKLNWKKDMPA